LYWGLRQKLAEIENVPRQLNNGAAIIVRNNKSGMIALLSQTRFSGRYTINYLIPFYRISYEADWKDNSDLST
jgi:hypothetical protein